MAGIALTWDRVVVAVEPPEPAAGSSTRTSCVDGTGVPVSAAWIDAAARRPSAIASIRFRGPRATSPPAQIRGCEVRSDAGSTSTPPGRSRSSAIAAEQVDDRRLCPTARITVSAAITSSVPGSNVGCETALGVEHRRDARSSRAR